MSKFDTRMKHLCNPKASRLSVYPEHPEEVDGHKFYPEQGIFVKGGKAVSLRSAEGQRLFRKTKDARKIAEENAKSIGIYSPKTGKFVKGVKNAVYDDRSGKIVMPQGSLRKVRRPLASK